MTVSVCPVLKIEVCVTPDTRLLVDNCQINFGNVRILSWDGRLILSVLISYILPGTLYTPQCCAIMIRTIAIF